MSKQDAGVDQIFISLSNDDDDDDPGMVITESIHDDHDDLTTGTIETEQIMADVISEEQIELEHHHHHHHHHLNEDDDSYSLHPPPSFQNIVVQHMDIAEPLTVLRKLLETKLQCSLKDHEFCLQDQIPLDPDRNLVEQCVQGEGMVQINAEIKSQPGSKPKINIVDILKQTEEIIESPAPAAPQQSKAATAAAQSDDAEQVTRWIVDQNFRKEQDRLRIPYDPVYWNQSHVMHWIEWAINEFQLDGVDAADFSEMTGHDLTELKHEQFQKLIPCDRGDIFWTHLELLRKCRFVAVVQQPTPQAANTVTVSTSNSNIHEGRLHKPYKPKKMPTSPRILGTGEDRPAPGNRSGNNGQIQLWQFLLELLTDKECREVIYWVGDEGEFKLNHPEMVAQMWGQRKNKATMTYEKLSRALRYYYDGDMISKVHGKRFTYKFVCDLKMLLGYSAAELNRLTTESAEKQLRKVREAFRPGTIIIGKQQLQELEVH